MFLKPLVFELIHFAHLKWHRTVRSQCVVANPKFRGQMLRNLKPPFLTVGTIYVRKSYKVMDKFITKSAVSKMVATSFHIIRIANGFNNFEVFSH